MLQDNVKFQFYCSIERKKTIKISGTISNINLSAHYSKIDKKVV